MSLLKILNKINIITLFGCGIVLAVFLFQMGKNSIQLTLINVINNSQYEFDLDEDINQGK